MRGFIVILALAALGLRALGGEVYDINGGWKFYNRGESASDNMLMVTLPHTWNAADAGPNTDYFRGVGNYLRDIEVPASWQGKRVFLRFYGANSTLTLIVNGRLAGEHYGGYTACTFEITPLIRFGSRNALWVMVNNSPRTDILPTGGDANCYGGLVRGVEMIVTPAVAIAPTDHSSSGVYVTSHKSDGGAWSGEVMIKLIASQDKNAQVSVVITDAAGNEAARGNEKVRVADKGLTAVVIPFTIEQPRLWDGVRDPHLYSVRVRIAVDNVPCDSTVVQTGLRDYGFAPQTGFQLNGQPYPLRGVTVTQDREGIGTALQPYHVTEDLALIREMGANIVCVSGAPYTQNFYDACDRAGIMVWSEIPFPGEVRHSDRAYFNTSAFRANGKQQLTEIIRQQFNHPSIVMWGLFSCLSQRGDNPADYVRELNALAKKEDPSRYTVCTSNQDGDLNFITDLVMWQQRFGWSEGRPSDLGVWLAYLQRSWSQLGSAVSYGAGGSIYDKCDSLMRPDPSGMSHPERWQTHVHEESYKCVKDNRQLWGVFVDNMFDYGSAGRNNYRGPGVNDMGLVTFDRKYRKDAFYFYKANWNTSDPFVYIAEWRWDVRRSAVQTLKVFSNCPEAELFINDLSLGVRRGENGVFTWHNVAMGTGVNAVVARSGELEDRVRITISPYAL